VKKVNKIPYFELKVVKVKKAEKNYNLCSPSCSWNGFCVHQHKQEKEKKKCIILEKKDSWVNDENLDKIKFPCFCSFDNQGKKCYGKIDKGYIREVDKDVYQISDITKQVDGSFTTGQMYSVIYTADTLKDLIHYHNVHILKGKIIIWEEEK